MCVYVCVASVLCQGYCHKIIKLSDALQEFAPEKEVICNVHGQRRTAPQPAIFVHYYGVRVCVSQG